MAYIIKTICTDTCPITTDFKKEEHCPHIYRHQISEMSLIMGRTCLEMASI